MSELEAVKKDANRKLWNGVRLNVLGVTGKHASGKSWFIISIDPEHTCLFDLEDSSTVYADYMPIAERHSLYDEIVPYVQGKQKGSEVIKPSPLQCFLWFRDHLEKLEPGKFTVLGVDPISDIEQGLVDYVKANPEEFGYTKNQFDNASALMWGAVKSYWKSILGIASSKVETLAFTTHMGNVFVGGKPTNKKQAKGKETLAELASLYLQLERGMTDEGKPRIEPTALVLKSRLAMPFKDESTGLWKLKPMIPPNVPKATYENLLGYIKDPKPYDQLSEDELPKEEDSLTDDERLILQAQMVSDEKELAEKKLATLTLSDEMARRRDERIKKSEAVVSAMTEQKPAEQKTEPKAEPKKEKKKEEPVPAASEQKPEPEPTKEEPSPLSAESMTAEMQDKTSKEYKDKLMNGIAADAKSLWGAIARDNLKKIMLKLNPDAAKLGDLSVEQLGRIVDAIDAAKKKKQA